MFAVDHPTSFKQGVRLVMRVWRNKEHEEGRRPGKTVITGTVDEWEAATTNLLAESIRGERVYASAECRDVERAIRVFKERQLAADYDAPIPRHDFYHNCFQRWISCLGSPAASAEKLFLFDCDTLEDYERLKADMAAAPAEYVGADKVLHTYPTKNGTHVVTKPFNPGLLGIESRRLLQKNPLLLVGWR